MDFESAVVGVKQTIVLEDVLDFPHLARSLPVTDFFNSIGQKTDIPTSPRHVRVRLPWNDRNLGCGIRT
jgi:hypothetical protein